MSFKPLAAAAALVLFASLPAVAQTPLLSVAIGPTYAWRTSNQPELESKGMLAMGGGGGFRFGRGTYSVQGEILIVTKGSKRTIGTGQDTRLKLEYIELPFMGIVTFNSDAQLRPFVGAGPVIDLEMRCKSQFVTENEKDEIACDVGNSATFDRHKVDFGVAGIAGVDYKMSGGRRISLQSRYNHGLRNISDSDDPSLVLKNRAVSFYVGYSFPLKPDL